MSSTLPVKKEKLLEMPLAQLVDLVLKQANLLAQYADLIALQEAQHKAGSTTQGTN